MTKDYKKVKNPGPEDQALAIPRGNLLCWQFIDLLKSQISNYKQFPMTEIRKSKQCLALKSFGH
ncbi:MAG: hypothetical protein QME06_08875 [Desulfobacterales bacterium]|nr:hypothetical protein [Desulfobacterales bacterium]